MPDYIKEKDIVRASSYTDTSLSRPLYQAIVEPNVEDPDPIFKEIWYDPLDPKITSIFENITSVSTHDYQRDPITTISYNYYGTTSGWWIILAYNGYMHQDEIPAGASLDIPDLDTIKSNLIKVQSLVGRKFVF